MASRRSSSFESHELLDTNHNPHVKSNIPKPVILRGLVCILGACLAALLLLIFSIVHFNSFPKKSLHYSSDLTRNILVKKIHSHNDYWRDRPLYTALSYGVQSVEADVWYLPEQSKTDTLYVGHSLASLTDERTFQRLYIDPLSNILSRTNPDSKFMSLSNHVNGVFDTDSYATLYLFVDFKTDGDALWPHVYNALEPLRSKGYLTYFDEDEETWHNGPITVIGTGNTPYKKVSELRKRDFFFDSPLENLNASYPSTIGPIASCALGKLVGEVKEISGLDDSQYQKLRKLVDDAHSKDILTRVWDTPWWPKIKQQNIWREILRAGSDFLNADDLEYASEFM
ncbi:hypothetical protein CANARDRAFT_196604 [[Candida] arabinofermentans NRRL YB-2248]|uniref:Altered inheritance of mitochondria protein 6 n=1 Tax=[Candida] arabinofermentans NRRL YB-2248 TaxID=983967 RepID=A0A1E4T3D0_9ASCO|nr:hypothetical protein CANARDRAFT_196604 [[Candida] arabinofermentans NRRL YB-2248]